MTQRQEIQLGQVPRSIVMAGEDQVGEHGDDRTRNERKCVDYSCPASRCGDNPTLFIRVVRMPTLSAAKNDRWSELSSTIPPMFK